MRRYLMQTLAYSLQRRIRIRSGGLWTLLFLVGISLLPNSLQAQCAPDVTDPIAQCQSFTAQLDASGSVTITGADVDNGSSDFCPGPLTLSVSPSTFSCADIGPNFVTLTVTDGAGNSASCITAVTVEDNVAPTAICQPFTVTLDATGNGSLTPADIDNGSNDACGAVTLAASQTAFTCADVGTNNVTLTVTDANSNVSTCVAVVTVVDNTPPTATCAPFTVVLDAAGNGTLTAADIDGGSSDLCGAVTLAASQTTFGCGDVGTLTVTLTVTDASSNVSTCNATVTVQDNTNPTATCIAGPLTVNLDVNGNATITAAQIDNGSTDACGPITLAVSPSSFTCADLGTNPVTLTVTDANGNVSTCGTTVNVVNPPTNIPSVVTQNITVNLDAAGNASITATDVDNGSSATCGIASFSVTPSSFTCTNVGPNPVLLTVTGVNGQANLAPALVTIVDVTPPVISCPGTPATVNAAAGDCDAAVTIALATATDACGPPTITNNFNGGGANASGTYPVGTTTVTFTAIDANGLTSTCTVDVTVNDVTPPTPICQNITVPLNAVGAATITAAMIDNGSNDACGIQSISASQTTFGCANLGVNNVTLTVTDNNGLTNTCVAVVTVTDAIPPVFSCPANITVNVQPGQCNAQVTYAISATDNCTTSPTIVRTVGLASGSAFPEGTTTVTHTATDATGNVSTCSFTVTVIDNELPVAVCAPITVQLDGSGAGSITASDIDGGSTDNCGIAAISASPSAFVCSDVGTVPVTLTVTDVNGNSSTCVATVTVADTIKPTAICQNVTVTLDAAGNGSTTAAAVDNGSTDACGIASLSLSQTTFGCADVGPNTVTLTVTDNNGNASTCTGVVTVVDNVPPTVVCRSSSPIAYLNGSGVVTILPAMVDSISTDACGIATRTVSPNTFGCADVGNNTVTLTVTDNNSNVSTCTSVIVVRDTIPPVALCQNVTVTLDAAGNGSTTAAAVDNGSNDACGIASLSLSTTTFGCADVGNNTVTLTVTDNNGNASTCTATVTVVDNIPPTVLTQSISINLDAAGNASIVPNQVNNGTSDNCGIAFLAVNPNSFTCANVGPNTVTLTATDVNGNSASATAVVTVADNIPPVITCPANVTINVDAGLCAGTVSTLGIPTATDICGIASITHASSVSTGGSDANGLYPVGTTTVTYTATDNNGNTSQCTVDVTVIDNENPTIVCNGNITVSNFPGACDAPVSYVVVSSDNCPGSSVLQTAGLVSGSLFPVGTTTNTFVVTDASGNTATCSFDVTVEDNQSPSIICPTDQIVSNDAGVCGAVITYTPPVGIDNCPLPSGATVLTAGLASGSTFPIGTTTVEYTVTDAVGQTAVCSFDVTVNDTENPTIACPADITVSNDAGVCGAVVTFATPLGADNCPGQTVTQTAGPASGATFPIGTTNVEFTVTDASGLTATCNFDVTVNDTENPTITCPANIVVSNDAGNCTAVVSYSVTGADNCPSFNIIRTAGPASGSAFPVGVTTVSHQITDASGNTASCSFTVTVNDTENPAISCPANIVVNNDLGNCSSVQTYIAPIGTDNCPGVSTVLLSGLASGSAFPVGVNTVSYRSTDAAGNTSDCSFTVTVVDNEVPVISGCPTNISQANDVGFCGATISWTLPTVSDNCGATLSSTHNPGDFFAVGTTSVIYTAVDAAGNSAIACTFDVTISDTELPVATCPANIVQPNDPGQCQAAVTVPNPTVTDNCVAGPFTIINDYNSTNDASDTYPVGTTTVTFTVTDLAGNSTTCSMDVTVEDTENPTILCPFPSQIALNGAGIIDLSTLVFFNQAVDNCGPVTFSFAPKTIFDCSDAGTTTVITITATDAAGNINTCTTALTVVDNVPPVVNCPANITQSVDAGLCSAVVTYVGPTFSDNCPAGVTINQTAGLASGVVFPIGTTTNTFEVTDAVGNVSTCSFDVTVVDSELPTISCPADIVQSNDPGLCSATITYLVPFSDNCPGAAISQTAGLASGSAFPIGTTTNTFVVTDATGNSATCSFDITINDTEFPVINCPADITVQATAGQCDAVVSYLVTLTDNCVTSPVPNLTTGLGSGATFPVGTTTETYTFTDPSGNTATCSFTVTVEDNVPPTLVCPADIVQSNDAGLCSAVVTWTAPTYSDNCGGAPIAGFSYRGTFGGNHYYKSDASMTWTAAQALAATTGGHIAVIESAAENAHVLTGTGGGVWIGYTDEVVEGTFEWVTGISSPYTNWQAGQPSNLGVDRDYTLLLPSSGEWSVQNSSFTRPFVLEIGASQIGGLVSGSVFPVGTTTINYQAADMSGNVSNCSFDITVEDNENPTIACPANISVNNDAGICGAVVNYTAPSFADNCPGSTITQTAGMASGMTFPVGTTTNTFVVTDAAGNTATCSFDVIVTDNENPTITCPADITVSNDANFCGALVTFADPTFADNCPGSTLAQTAGLPSGSIFPVGTNTITYVVTDAAGLTATCSFDVTVNDTENPTIVCPANITQSVDVASCDAVVTYTVPSFSDNCPGASSVLTSGIGSGGTFPLGVSTETYTVTDASGNTATCSFTITILDQDPPTITCPGDQTVSAAAGICSAVVTYAAVTATDGCPGLGSVIQTAGLSSGSSFPLGTTTNTFAVTDAGGNTSTCSFDVTVEDNENPVINCPANITIFANGGQCTAFYIYTGVTASDNCGAPTVSLLSGLGSGGSFPVGVNTETYQAVDASGNVATCSFTITVVDNQTPTITCPADIVVGNDAGICGAIVSFGNPTFTDNCPGSTLTQTAGIASGGTFPLGTTTNTFVITDPSGNTATCSFDVTVNDTEGPTINCPANIVVTAGVGLCDAIVTYAGVTAVDNCPGAVTITLTGGLNSGANFPVGVTTVTYEAVDIAGNPSTCSFTVTVNAAVPITQAVINNAIDPLSLSLEECEDIDINLSASVPNPGMGESGTWTFISTPPASFTFTPNANDPNAVLSGVTASPPIYELEWAITDGCITTRDTIRVQINPTPTGIIVETVPISVFGAADGELLAIPLSGTPGYFFEWDDAPTFSTDPSAMNLATGNYSVVITDTKGCDDTLFYFLDQPLAQTVLVSPTVILGGAIDLITGEMDDDLRGLADFPLTEPYTATGYPAINAGSSLTTNAGVLAVTGSDAIVDWVLVELRDKTDRTTVLGRQPALIQADGDIVDAGDGTSPVAIIGLPDDYYVAIRHRNHLGVMSDAVISLNDITTTLADFSDGSVTPYQLPLIDPTSRIPLQTLNQGAFSGTNGFALWGGDANGDKIVTYAGTATDISPIQLKVLFDLGNPGFSTTHQVLGYNTEDLNMDSNVTYAGATTDVSVITINVLLHPDNFGLFNLTFQIFEQIP